MTNTPSTRILRICGGMQLRSQDTATKAQGGGNCQTTNCDPNAAGIAFINGRVAQVCLHLTNVWWLLGVVHCLLAVAQATHKKQQSPTQLNPLQLGMATRLQASARVWLNVQSKHAPKCVEGFGLLCQGDSTLKLALPPSPACCQPCQQDALAPQELEQI